MQPYSLEIPIGSTFHFATAVALGARIPFTSSAAGLGTDIAHCLEPGDRLLLCDIPENCQQLTTGECVTVVETPTVQQVTTNISLPAGTEGCFYKAADLAGFHLVMRVGQDAEERYLNHGAICASENQMLVKGCHDVPIGSQMELNGVRGNVTAVIDGTDGGEDYTLLILDAKAPKKVDLGDYKFAIAYTPQPHEYHGKSQGCGIIHINLSPTHTRQYKRGSRMPFSISLERGWDITAYNEKYGLNCPWKPDFSHLLFCGEVCFV